MGSILKLRERKRGEGFLDWNSEGMKGNAEREGGRQKGKTAKASLEIKSLIR